MTAGITQGVGQRLREAGPEELAPLVDEWLGHLDPGAALLVLRNLHCTREVVRRLLGRPALLHSYEVRRELAMHRFTPEIDALRLVPGLFWRDLVAVGRDTRVRPMVRRAADQRLLERLSSLALGERVAIARRASPSVLAALRRDPNPRVLAAMLENPRLTEGLLMPLASSENAAPAVLEVLAADQRWGIRYPVRCAIARNPRTPVATALRILPLLKKVDLRAVASGRRLAEAVRRRARLLLGEA